MSSTKYAIKSRSARLILQLSVIKGVENFSRVARLLFYSRILFQNLGWRSFPRALPLPLSLPPHRDLLIRERCTISKLKGRSQEGLRANLPKFLDFASSSDPRIISSSYPPVKVILFPNIERKRVRDLGEPNRAEEGSSSSRSR